MCVNSKPITHEEFRSACSRFPTGVTVTTVMESCGQPRGITVSSFTSVSLDPPLVLVCIDRRSPIIEHLKINQYFAVNVLSDQQRDLSIQFSNRWSERFSNVRWYPGHTGAPLLFDVPAAFECRVVEVVIAGDHFIIIGVVLHLSSVDKQPLAYLNSRYGQVISNVDAKPVEVDGIGMANNAPYHGSGMQTSR